MFGEHLATAFTHIRRSPYHALAAVLVMSLTFFAASIIAFLAYAAQVTLYYFETRPQIILFLKNDASPEQISTLQRKLIENPKVSGEVKFVSHEEAFKIFQGFVENPLVTELVPIEVIPASLEFSVAELSYVEELISQLKREVIVDSVEFTGSLGGEGSISAVVERLEKITRYIRIGGVAVLSFLALTATLILVVVISMRISARREEIETLRLLGATASFIRAPFLFEGISYGVLGSLIGFLASLLLLLYTMPTLAQYFGEIPVIPQDFSTLTFLVASLFAGELALAFLIGILGSFLAISRYLRL